MDIAILASHAVARVGAKTADGWTLCRLERIDPVSATYAVADDTKRTGTLRALHAPLATFPEVVRAFDASARLGSDVPHEDAAALVGNGALPEGPPYVVLDVSPGETLSELVARRPGRIPPAEALRLVGGVLQVLAAAHAAGVIHGALGPDEVVVTETGAVKVLGFGLRPLLAEAARALGVPSLRPSEGFAAPELTAHPPPAATAGSDLWSAGALLYYLLTGDSVPPINPRDGPREAPSPPRNLAAVGVHLPECLEALVARGIATAPEARFPSAPAFGAAVGQAMLRIDVASLGPPRPSGERSPGTSSPGTSSPATASPAPGDFATSAPVVAAANAASRRPSIPAWARATERGAVSAPDVLASSPTDPAPASATPEPQPQPAEKTPRRATAAWGSLERSHAAVGAAPAFLRREHLEDGVPATTVRLARAHRPAQAEVERPLRGAPSSLAEALGWAWAARDTDDALDARRSFGAMLSATRALPVEEIALEVRPWGLEGEAGSSWEAPDALRSRLHSLYARGLRRLVFGGPLEESSLQALLELPAATGDARGAQDRLVTLGGLLHGAVELRVESPADILDDDPRLQAERREVVALCGFDFTIQLEEGWRAQQRRRPREAAGVWRAALAADLAPWLEDLPWERDPSRRAALCQRLLGDGSVADAWGALTSSIEVAPPEKAARRGAAETRALAVRALAALIEPAGAGAAGAVDGAAERLVEALARCGAEGDTTLTFAVVGGVLRVNGEPLLDNRGAHQAALHAGLRLREHAIREVSLATTLTVRSARELGLRFGAPAGAAGRDGGGHGPIPGVTLATRGEGSARPKAGPLTTSLVGRYADGLVALRSSFAPRSRDMDATFATWRGLARRMADAPPGPRGAALAIALAATHQDAAARGLHTSLIAATAAQAIGADRSCTARLVLAALLLAAARGLAPPPAPEAVAGRVAELAARAAPRDDLGRAATVIAARAAERLTLRKPGSSQPPGARPISRAPPSQGTSASSELLAAVVDFFDALCPPSAVEPLRTPVEALRAVVVGGARNHNALGALIAGLGGLPVGSVVEVDDGSWAVVVAPPPHARDVDRPVVALITDATGQALSTPLTRDLGAATTPPDRVARLIPTGFVHFNVARVIVG